MAKFIDHNEGYAFEDNGGYQIPLNDQNYWVWRHRDLPLKDTAQVEDDRDGLSWYWDRYEVGDEVFNQLDMMAQKVGVVILRSLPVEGIEQMFDRKHQIDVDEIQDFLDGLSDEPRD